MTFEVRGECEGLWEELTPREQEVAALAALELSDGEIARELAIAETTVGNHLGHIFGKLEIHSRHELKYIVRRVNVE